MLLMPGRLLGAHLLAPIKTVSVPLTDESGTAFLTTEDGLPLA